MIRTALRPILGGVSIYKNPYCLASTKDRLFPASRHRSKRVHKKLIKRYGGEFKQVPAIFQPKPGVFICHPALYERLNAAIDKTLKDQENA